MSIEKYFGGNICAIFKVLTWNFPGGSEENYKELQ
jgi:hypothetical protein